MGRRIVGYFYLACGSCAACRAGHDPHCARLAGWLGVHRDGGYATHTIIPAVNALPVPDELDPVQATAVPDAIATPLHVCKTRLGLTPLDRVVVIGAGGGVGIHMVQMARLFGASVCGLETREDKFDAVRAAGGEPVSSHDWQSITLPVGWQGAPPTAVINLVGTPASFRWSLDVLGMGGSLVVLTTFRNVSMDVDPRTLVFREIRVLGSRYASRAEVMEAAGLVAAGKIRPVVSHVVQPHEIETVHEELRQGQLLGRGAVRWAAD
jgi:propanol-preferring alcohol dehydrogenase